MGKDLPTGTVTLLFTDVEGSTKLLHELGAEAYAEALAEHRRIVRAACAAKGGVEVDTQGDAFFFAFASAPGAVAAAHAMTETLAPDRIHLRIGLHTGTPVVTAEGYVGDAVHLAARVAASAHGGQVVLSKTTRELVDGLPLTDLGEHRLKDIEGAVPIYQLGEETFPPLKTISNTNLPRPASSFVGRRRERDELVSMLADGTRLLTLYGPGGSGKTRLALEAASELVPAFKAGVFWVALAALRDPALVGETVAQALGAKDGLADHIAERELLLLLDNFEQVVEAAPELSELLERCPNLKLLVTSRELLRIRGEIEYPVPPLAEPEAIELFCERSRLEPDETIAEVCRRLDELPLALELAAARTSVLSPAQILERLSQRLDLLRGGRDVDPRQQTLRATIAWSHDLLEPEEQRLFASLAVFRGGCTLEAAEQVADAALDTLQSLVHKSLLRRTDERFWMLETIREYARERLSAGGEETMLRRRQAVFVSELAETAMREMEEGGDQAARLTRIDAEFDNVRAALEWARDAGESKLLLCLVAAIHSFWTNRGLYDEADKWLPLALGRAESPVDARMNVLQGAAGRAISRGEYARADQLIAEWRSLAERLGDEAQLLGALNSAGLNATQRGHFDDARAQFVAIKERARASGDRDRVAVSTVNLALVALESGDFDAGLAIATEAVELFRELRDDGGVAAALNNCAICALQLSDPACAEESFRDALLIGARLGWKRLIASTALGLAAALVAQHQDERGVQLLAATMALREEHGLGFDDELDEVIYDQAVADARAALGERAFAAAWARGEAMTPEEMVAFATPP